MRDNHAQDQDLEGEAQETTDGLPIMEDHSALSPEVFMADEVSFSSASSSTGKKRKQVDDAEGFQVEKLELLKKQCARYEQPTPKLDNVDKFFSSICDTVKQFPKEEIAKLKLKISQLVGEVEVRLAEEEARRVSSVQEPLSIVFMNEENQ